MELVSRALLAKQKARIAFPKGFKLENHFREVGPAQNGHRIYEFIGVDTFSKEWTQRQRFEIDAGRDEEPILYTPLYEVVNDSGLPELINVNTMGPGGVIFEEVKESGEVQFSGVTQGQYAVPMRHWATGLEYSKDLIIYNQTWNIAIMERAMGIAHNALMNHLHLYPYISFTYPAANKTPAATGGASKTENMLFTLENAIIHARADATNPRRGPYILLANTGDVFALERMLRIVPQQGLSVQATSAINAVRSTIIYDGWSGKRGFKTVTYPGVPAGKAYLISQQYKGQDAVSYIKQELQNEGTERDITRFMTQSVWDSYSGVYVNPLRSTEEIVWPV